MSRDRQIVVAGAGVVGLTAAALVATRCRQVSVTVLDAADGPPRESTDIGLRVSAIANGSIELLEFVGAWDRVADNRRCAYERMRVWDAADAVDSPSALRFAADEFGLKTLGEIVENASMQRALLHRLEVLGVDVHYGQSIDAVEHEAGKAVVRCADGQWFAADLLIGADGVHSTVRNCAGLVVRRWPYAQTAIVTHLTPEHSHANTAWQRFLPTGPVALLPLADGRVSTVWSTTDADTALDADDDALGEMISEASDYALGRLTVDGPRGSFPLNAHHAEQYVVENIALIGDAAHAIHPLAGQGANLGLQDANQLVQVVSDALAAGLHPGERRVLRRYERARKGANATMLHGLTALNRLFASNMPLVRELRRTGMQLFNSSGPVRERAVQVALGGET